MLVCVYLVDLAGNKNYNTEIHTHIPCGYPPAGPYSFVSSFDEGRYQTLLSFSPWKQLSWCYNFPFYPSDHHCSSYKWDCNYLVGIYQTKEFHHLAICPSLNLCHKHSLPLPLANHVWSLDLNLHRFGHNC